MAEEKKKGQTIKKGELRVIDYIDDRGERHRKYTSNTSVEKYIKNTYTIIEKSSSKNLTSQKFCDMI